MRRVAIIILLSMWLTPGIADIANTPDVNTSTPSTVVVENNPATWDLKTEEWTRYQQLMQGPSGRWYPHATPAEILGLNARTPQEQQHYAEIVAKEQHDRVAHELAFANAIQQSLFKLYPHEPIVKPFDITPFNPIRLRGHTGISLNAGDHVVLFVDPTQGLDFVALPPLLADINHHARVVLDIFCVGAVDDSDIRRWASLNNIPNNLVESGRITLNIDRGEFQKTVGSGSLPFVLLVRDGESKAVSLRSLS